LVEWFKKTNQLLVEAEASRKTDEEDAETDRNCQLNLAVASLIPSESTAYPGFATLRRIRRDVFALSWGTTPGNKRCRATCRTMILLMQSVGWMS
jgi:hypothetical protein